MQETGSAASMIDRLNSSLSMFRQLQGRRSCSPSGWENCCKRISSGGAYISASTRTRRRHRAGSCCLPLAAAFSPACPRSSSTLYALYAVWATLQYYVLLLSLLGPFSSVFHLHFGGKYSNIRGKRGSVGIAYSVDTLILHTALRLVDQVPNRSFYVFCVQYVILSRYEAQGTGAQGTGHRAQATAGQLRG